MNAKKRPAKRKAARKQTRAKTSSAKKSKMGKSKTSNKPRGRQKAVAKRKAVRKQTSARRREGVEQRKRQTGVTAFSGLGRTQVPSGQESGDLQGLSRAEQADSESVDELIEEGNAFEADAVAGVEEADNADEREVHTHEVPEDDVPDEYLDKD